MGAGLQRSRIYSRRGWQRSRSGSLLEPDENLHDWIRGLLDPDERLILPEDYVDNWTMYDQICGTGYFIRDDNAPDPEALDFVWSKDLKRMEKEGHDMDKITIVDKVLIVRLRMPWNKVDTEWLASEEDLENYGDEVEILEIYVRARRKDSPNDKPELLLSPASRRAFEAAPDGYEVIETSYLLAWKMSPETREMLLR